MPLQSHQNTVLEKILHTAYACHSTHEHNNYYHILGCCYDPRGDPRPGHPSPETLPPGPGILSQYQEESSLSHVNYFAGVSRKFLNIIISTMYNTLCSPYFKTLA